jgi:hypothetical protein
MTRVQPEEVTLLAKLAKLAKVPPESMGEADREFVGSAMVAAAQAIQSGSVTGVNDEQLKQIDRLVAQHCR